MTNPNLLDSTLTMILAGGQGERLYPLTREVAKPAVPFGGIYRIIDFTLSNCINSNLRKIYVLTQYKSSSLDRHLRRGWSFLHPELGEYIYTIPPQQQVADLWYRGTADAIYQNIYTLEQEKPERVLILSGDHIYKMDYSRMIDSHVQSGADLPVACVEVPLAQASHLGVMAVDESSRITGFQEKPESPAPVPGNPDVALASMGIYVFSTSTLVRTVSEEARRSQTRHDFGLNIIPRLVDSGKVFAYNLKDTNRNTTLYWRDIGRLGTYWEANMDLLEKHPEFDLYDESWPIRTFQVQRPPARVRVENAQSVRAIISNGCDIDDARVHHSILSPGVTVQPDASVTDSILMEGVDVGAGAVVRKAIVDHDVVIPPNSRIGVDAREDGQRFTITPEGIVVVPSGIQLDGA
jgi:glucose-1-phosphate adenylyltransferase